MYSSSVRRQARRKFLMQAASAAALGATGVSVSAAEWPSRPVRLVVVFPAGGSVDNSTRIFADRLRELLRVPVIVENRPGGSTIVGTQSVLAAPRDGYTFLVSIPLTMYLPVLLSKVPFDPQEDLVPVGPLTFEQLVLVASAKSGITTFEDMRKRVKADPSQYSFASYGIGTDAHLLAVHLAKEWGANLLHVPYSGGLPSVQAVVSGQTTFTMGPAAICKQFIDSGALVPLAVRGHPRSPFYPNVPTLTELGVQGFKNPVWCGLFAARGTPPEAVTAMATALRECALTPALQARLQQAFNVSAAMDQKQFARLAREAADIDGVMFRAAGIRMDG